MEMDRREKELRPGFLDKNKNTFGSLKKKQTCK
jgi:hypothetical protein